MTAITFESPSHLSMDARQETRWAEQIDRLIVDVIDVQTEIAQHIAEALRPKLSARDRAAVSRPPTSNPQAYNLYLRSTMWDPSSRALLTKALSLDPHFAAARALLAYITMASSYRDNGAHLDDAISLAKGAIADDPELPLPYAVLGSAYSMKGLDTDSRLSFLRALELNPNDTTAMANLSIHETSYGRLDEGLDWARRVVPLTVADSNARYHVGIALITLRDDGLTDRWLQTAARQFPTNPRLQIELSELELLKGQPTAALSRLDSARRVWPTIIR